MQQLKRTQEALRTATADYIRAKRDKQVAEASAVSAEASLASELERASQKVCANTTTMVTTMLADYAHIMPSRSGAGTS